MCALVFVSQVRGFLAVQGELEERTLSPVSLRLQVCD